MNQPGRLPAHADEPALLPRVCELWSEILGKANIDADLHFFLAGGDSLQMVRLLMRLHTEWGVELQLARLWQFSTPRKMAACCSELIVKLHCRKYEASCSRNTWDFPASCSQQGLWFSELQADSLGLYNSAVVLALRGPLVVAVLEAALNALCLQFPLLKCCLQPDVAGRHLRVMIPAYQPAALQVAPLPPYALHTQTTTLQAMPFESGLGLWRCRLYSHADDWHSLLLCSHHCLIDGWSGRVLLRHLALAYNALLSDPHWLPAVRDSAFARHCWRQQEYLCSELHADNLLWWQNRLAGLASQPATIPWQASAQHWPYRLQSRRWLWSPGQLQQLQLRCAESEVTLFAALVAALASALALVSGHQEQLIAFPVAARSLPDEENSVGCYMNLLPIRLNLVEEETLHQLLMRVHEDLTQLQAHAAPWQSLVQSLRPPLLADGNAWTQVVLAWQNLPALAASFDGLGCQQQSLPSPFGQHVLKFEVTTANDGLSLQVDYAEAVLSAAVVEQLATDLLSRLQALVL